MIDKELIGLESEPVSLKITAEAVRRFTEALGIPFDGMVPPTFVGTLLRAKIPGLQLPMDGAIHGEQKFIYYQPLRIGDSLTYIRRIQDIYQRTGRLGQMTLMVIESKGFDFVGELKFCTSSTLIFLVGEGTK